MTLRQFLETFEDHVAMLDRDLILHFEDTFFDIWEVQVSKAGRIIIVADEGDRAVTGIPVEE